MQIFSFRFFSENPLSIGSNKIEFLKQIQYYIERHSICIGMFWNMQAILTIFFLKNTKRIIIIIIFMIYFLQWECESRNVVLYVVGGFFI